mmetsp:Transcript_22436/g.52910  ORF Transcript_22436/g.52910 Transcript_22436/m.52910 type:complete len:258 (-) Transcript_22436:1878-2651(-)
MFLLKLAESSFLPGVSPVAVGYECFSRSILDVLMRHLEPNRSAKKRTMKAMPEILLEMNLEHSIRLDKRTNRDAEHSPKGPVADLSGLFLRLRLLLVGHSVALGTSPLATVLHDESVSVPATTAHLVHQCVSDETSTFRLVVVGLVFWTVWASCKRHWRAGNHVEVRRHPFVRLRATCEDLAFVLVELFFLLCLGPTQGHTSQRSLQTVNGPPSPKMKRLCQAVGDPAQYTDAHFLVSLGHGHYPIGPVPSHRCQRY